jgi:hypothetical protein
MESSNQTWISCNGSTTIPRKHLLTLAATTMAMREGWKLLRKHIICQLYKVSRLWWVHIWYPTRLPTERINRCRISTQTMRMRRKRRRWSISRIQLLLKVQIRGDSSSKHTQWVASRQHTFPIRICISKTSTPRTTEEWMKDRFLLENSMIRGKHNYRI